MIEGKRKRDGMRTDKSDILLDMCMMRDMIESEEIREMIDDMFENDGYGELNDIVCEYLND